MGPFGFTPRKFLNRNRVWWEVLRRCQSRSGGKGLADGSRNFNYLFKNKDFDQSRLQHLFWSVWEWSTTEVNQSDHLSAKSKMFWERNLFNKRVKNCENCFVFHLMLNRACQKSSKNNDSIHNHGSLFCKPTSKLQQNIKCNWSRILSTRSACIPRTSSKQKCFDFRRLFFSLRL